jgi:hypothetical protein
LEPYTFFTDSYGKRGGSAAAAAPEHVKTGNNLTGVIFFNYRDNVIRKVLNLNSFDSGVTETKVAQEVTTEKWKSHC